MHIRYTYESKFRTFENFQIRKKVNKQSGENTSLILSMTIAQDMTPNTQESATAASEENASTVTQPPNETVNPSDIQTTPRRTSARLMQQRLEDTSADSASSEADHRAVDEKIMKVLTEHFEMNREEAQKHLKEFFDDFDVIILETPRETRSSTKDHGPTASDWILFMCQNCVLSNQECHPRISAKETHLFKACGGCAAHGKSNCCHSGKIIVRIWEII